MNNKASSFLLLVCLVLVGCATSPSVSPLAIQTPDPIQVFVDANSSQATAVSAAATAQFYSAQLTATVEAQHATATERAWLMQATQQAAEITSTARVWEATVTADSLSATSAAAQAATAQSIQTTATQQVWNTTATANEASSQAYATAMAGEAISVELAVQRERMTNKVKAVVPWVFLVAVFVVSLALAIRWSRVRPVLRDARGDAPLLVIDGKVYDADRNPYPLLDLSQKKPEIPALVPPELQAPTTARDQMIDLTTRGSLDAPSNDRRKSAAKQMASQNMGALPTVKVLPPEQVRPLLKDVLPGIVRDAIEADVLNPTDEGGTS